ncbi:UbiA family prenyltransferase [Pseudoflavitalea sp. G-6-1-2]|uniref:UbiA family prenyltransferase n=1 Tax=Pseudoflavitalea sp. G-6-1-2 TaxID=2728841 RepID=UPI00146CA122|nr:UbiA family prenyltransferase [Pseudoflavitalea sp. G-6-1-2]NML20640.1 UbiA family prenyltransferase [Pseudoflavitalea sp. G-6-1-2]
MLQRSTIQLLRFHFSFFLLPVYLFALGMVPVMDTKAAWLVFIILHLLVYPASNGYNSYMDRDEGSIGGLEKPMQPTKQLFYVTIAMDLLAVVLSFFISTIFAAGIVAYILASRAYSYRGIRLKQYAVAGYATVVLFQGAVTFFLVYHACSEDKSLKAPPGGIIAAALLIGAFYPITQVYQHEADRKDGVQTLSALLGIRGTFIFTACLYAAAMVVLAWLFWQRHQSMNFYIIATAMLPALVYFFSWASAVWKNTSMADFRRTMQMNLIASLCSNLAFLIILTGRFI